MMFVPRGAFDSLPLAPTAHVAALRVDDPSAVGEVRRAATALATTLGFDETTRGRVAIVATELAGNLAKHARDGTVLLLPTGSTRAPGITILGIDRGPGIGDIGRALEDGYSTAGTPGTGLGAVRRLADEFDLYSRSEEGVSATAAPAGTLTFARLWAQPAGAAAARVRTGALDVDGVCLPAPGETAIGDAWCVDDARDTGGACRLLIADGLGHGPLAAAASAEAVRLFRGSPDLGPAESLRMLHDGLRSSRGAAVAVAELRSDEGVVRYAAVGNIAATIVGPNSSRSLVSHNGTVGHQMRTVQELDYAWPADALLVAHSDGLKSHWRLDAYAGIAEHRAALVSAALWRDHLRGRDDVTVVVVKGTVR
jgi:anti-sigma regulatory factor (Ser/Thr protein kinase)